MIQASIFRIHKIAAPCVQSVKLHGTLQCASKGPLHLGSQSNSNLYQGEEHAILSLVHRTYEEF